MQEVTPKQIIYCSSSFNKVLRLQILSKRNWDFISLLKAQYMEWTIQLNNSKGEFCWFASKGRFTSLCLPFHLLPFGSWLAVFGSLPPSSSIGYRVVFALLLVTNCLWLNIPPSLSVGRRALLFLPTLCACHVLLTLQSNWLVAQAWKELLVTTLCWGLFDLLLWYGAPFFRIFPLASF